MDGVSGGQVEKHVFAAFFGLGEKTWMSAALRCFVSTLCMNSFASFQHYLQTGVEMCDIKISEISSNILLIRTYSNNLVWYDFSA